MGLKPEILEALAEIEFIEPTPVQQQIIPFVLKGVDCLVQAPTGTGKTAAFGIPIINNIDLARSEIQAVILCPTRELALQIESNLKLIASKRKGLKVLAIYGGQNMDRQLASIRKKPHVIVGTTGRIMDHLRRHTLRLDTATTVVLDEADEMLDMGFREDIDTILNVMPKTAQKLLFSATIPKEIMELSTVYQKDAVFVKTTCDGKDLPLIDQYVLYVQEKDKYQALRRVISQFNYKTVLVFCNTRLRVEELNARLISDYYLSMALHGDLRQRERDKVMRNFRQKEINILVATDVAARGIDVDEIEAIINYDLPVFDEYYIHRIGRTARASKSGKAYSFATPRDKFRVAACENVSKVRMKPLDLDGLTIKVKQPSNIGTRFFLNIGIRDGVTAENLIGFISFNADINDEEIFDVKLFDIYSFVSVSSENADKLLTLNKSKCFNRVLNIEQAGERSQLKSKIQSNKKSESENKRTSSKRQSRPTDKTKGGANSARTPAKDRQYDKNDQAEKENKKPTRIASKERSYVKDGKTYGGIERPPFNPNVTCNDDASTEEKPNKVRQKPNRNSVDKKTTVAHKGQGDNKHIARPDSDENKKSVGDYKGQGNNKRTAKANFDDNKKSPYPKRGGGKAPYSKNSENGKTDKKPFSRTNPTKSGKSTASEKSKTPPYNREKKPYRSKDSYKK